jgi:hypothetical protein
MTDTSDGSAAAANDKTVTVVLDANNVESSVDTVLRQVEARNKHGVMLISHSINMNAPEAKLTFRSP